MERWHASAIRELSTRLFLVFYVIGIYIFIDGIANSYDVSRTDKRASTNGERNEIIKTIK